MTHRLIHLLMLAATILFAACTGVDESIDQLSAGQQDDQQPIDFSAYLSRSTTRAGQTGVLTKDALATPGFGVFAYYTDGRLYNQLSLPDFMYNQRVTSGDRGTTWTYSPVKYWPNETGTGTTRTGADRLTFFAYAPYVDVDPSTGRAADGSTTGIVALSRAVDNGDPIVRYYTSMKPSEAVDLCWGTPHVDATKQSVSDRIVFNFRHALAALNVKIDADVDVVSHPAAPSDARLDDNTRIYVRSITFTGFADRGQLNLYSESSPVWNNLDCDCDLTSHPITIYDGRRDASEGVAESLNEQKRGLNPAIVQSDPYTLTGEPKVLTSTTTGVTAETVNLFDVSDKPSTTPDEKTAALVAPIYVIPTNDHLRVTIVYDVETYDPKLVSQYLSDGKTHGSTIENSLSADILTGGGDYITMQAGRQYTVHLHLGMASVKVSAEVSDWQLGANAEVHLPE